MVNRLFLNKTPRPESTILDPGCGAGAFIEGIIRWCTERHLPLPRIVGVESDPRHFALVRRKPEKFGTVEIRQRDFLTDANATYDFIIGNPPYVPITELSEEEKARYRLLFETARGRFDLYLLFFEQALKSLKPDGCLVFITPEKFLYVETAAPLRRLLAARQVQEIRMVDEETFGELVTYPTITTVLNSHHRGRTKVVLRNGKTSEVALPSDGSSWLPAIHSGKAPEAELTLGDICLRVSCGVATGLDSVFVQKTRILDPELLRFAYPTIAGRQLGSKNGNLRSPFSMLIPYSKEGRLLDESDLGALKRYLSLPSTRSRLLQRTCVTRKPWYAFHETPRLSEILRPKILCKDITARPEFWTDRAGKFVPRHSVYYIVPKDAGCIEKLCEYLNSEAVEEWLRSHCQRAANEFLRLQSRILKQLPVPSDLALSRSPSRSGPRQLAFSHSPAPKRPVFDSRNHLLEFAR